MKNKHIFIIIAVVLVIAFVLGITGAVTFKDYKNIPDDRATELLVGMFITTEPLNGRTYAEKEKQIYTDEETGEKSVSEIYTFPSLEGWGIYTFDIYYEGTDTVAYGNRVIDDIFCDCEIKNGTKLVNGTFNEEDTIKATIYTTTENFVLYQNPVYQSSNGKVYTEAGSGMNVSEFAEGTQSIDGRITISENGETKEKLTHITLTMKNSEPIKEINLYEMSKDNVVLKSVNYKPGKAPLEYYPLSETEYIIAETVTEKYDKENRARKIISYDDDETKWYFDHFAMLDNGMYKQYQTYIEW